MADTPRPPHVGAAPIVVTLPREIDLDNADRVGEDLEAAFGSGGMVVADMSGTRFCDTSGIHTLVMAHKQAKASNTAFRVVLGPGDDQRAADGVAECLTRAPDLFREDHRGKPGHPQSGIVTGQGP